jgi:hypothetical protein
MKDAREENIITDFVYFFTGIEKIFENLWWPLIFSRPPPRLGVPF